MYVCKCVCAHVLCVLIGQNEPIFFFSFPGHRLRKLMRQFSEVEPFIANLIPHSMGSSPFIATFEKVGLLEGRNKVRNYKKKQRKGGLIDKKKYRYF